MINQTFSPTNIYWYTSQEKMGCFFSMMLLTWEDGDGGRCQLVGGADNRGAGC